MNLVKGLIAILRFLKGVSDIRNTGLSPRYLLSSASESLRLGFDFGNEARSKDFGVRVLSPNRLPHAPNILYLSWVEPTPIDLCFDASCTAFLGLVVITITFMWCSKDSRRPGLRVSVEARRPMYKYTRSGRRYGRY